MNSIGWRIILLLVVLTEAVIALGVWYGLSWVGTAAIGAVGVSAIAARLIPDRVQGRFWSWAAAIIAWACTLKALVTLMLVRHKVPTFGVEASAAAISWLMAATILPASLSAAGPPLRASWKLAVMAWAFFGGWFWLGASYKYNLAAAFYVGLLINLALLVVCKRWFRMPLWGIQIVNTLILLIVGLPIADLFVSPAQSSTTRFEPGKGYYRYETARKHRAGYVWWLNTIREQSKRLDGVIWTYTRHDPLPRRLRPNSRAT